MEENDDHKNKTEVVKDYFEISRVRRMMLMYPRYYLRHVLKSLKIRRLRTIN
jgi:hypothetical protein